MPTVQKNSCDTFHLLLFIQDNFTVPPMSTQYFLAHHITWVRINFEGRLRSAEVWVDWILHMLCEEKNYFHQRKLPKKLNVTG